MNRKLRHRFKMLRKIRERTFVDPLRVIRAMRSFEKEKENVQTDFDSTESNDTEKFEAEEDELARTVF